MALSNEKYNANLVRASDYKVRMLFEETVVNKDIRQARRDSGMVLFTLDNVDIYGKDIDGCLNMRTEQIHFYIYHTEALLRQHILRYQLEFLDLSMSDTLLY